MEMLGADLKKFELDSRLTSDRGATVPRDGMAESLPGISSDETAAGAASPPIARQLFASSMVMAAWRSNAVTAPGNRDR